MRGLRPDYLSILATLLITAQFPHNKGGEIAVQCLENELPLIRGPLNLYGYILRASTILVDLAQSSILLNLSVLQVGQVFEAKKYFLFNFQ
jgi:hypothetical protein